MVLGFLVRVLDKGSIYIQILQAHGYATHEFEVTPERLGCYLPARAVFHIIYPCLTSFILDGTY